LLTVAVTPGANPTSTGLAVSADLTPIGGVANQQFYDDGSHGDVTSGDNTFSFTTTVAVGTSGGNKSMNATITDAQARGGSATIPLTVLAPTPPTGTGSASPASVFPGDSTLLTVNVTPGTNPTSTGVTVTADLTSIGGSASQAFSGSGNTFTFNATVGNATTPGAKALPFTITDAQARNGSGSIALTVKTPVPANDVVISQVYGGGGNTGATLKYDYIELINHSGAPVSLNGWSVQAFVPLTGVWAMTPLPNFTLQPGQYFLIQESQGAGGTDDLPVTPDATGTIAVSSASTKVAVVNNTTLLTGCPESDPGAYGIVDLVGYGASTDCWEGSGTAPGLDNLTALFRRNEGCFDTNDNANDFITGETNPRNSSSPTHDCTPLFAYGTANPSSVVVGNSTTLTVDVAPAQNPASTGISVVADLSAIGGSANQSFSGSGNLFTYTATVSMSTTGGFKSLPVTVTDAQSRSFNTNIVLSVLPLIADHITMSQIYGGGGNAGATYRNDYVELYNPTASPVNVTGWSIQYASAAGTSWTNKQPIGGTIGPGEYYLVALGSGGANGALLPASQISGSINISATTGKLALVKNSDALSGGCPLGTDPDIVDFVGYGSTASCREGTANAPAPSNTTAIFRKNNGSQDTDQNGNDFVTGAPNPRQTAPIQELGPWIAGTDPNTNSNTAPHDASVTIDFSEPVDVDSGWYNISCASTGSHNDATVAHTNDFKTYAITPNANFQFSEQCTVTIFKTAIHDQDTDDATPDTDNLTSDYTWSFTVVAAGQPAPYPPSVHLTMGNPSNATASTSDYNNYLMEKPTYALSYNRDKGTPNWVSWHLDSSWYGTLARVDVFRPDPKVDPSWYRVQAFDYAGSGFDRGHMTPNADRDNQNRLPINQETYLMSNMVPQAPANNQGPWADLEAYLRTQTDAGSEIYIVSGPAGVGGTGSNGFANSVGNGHVTVPASTWKVALFLSSAGGDDVSRVTCSTRTLAVIMPNDQSINSDWHTYITTVDAVEQLTGYDLYSNVPPAVQACIEAGTNGTNPPGTGDQTASTAEETPVTVHLQGLQSTAAPLTFSIVSGPTSGQLGSVGTATCSSGVCTADVDYTPGNNFFGSDSFTFKASNGTNFSNTSTVTITVNNVEDAPDAVDDSSTIAEDSGANVINVLTNDTDVDNDNLTVTAVTQGSHGSVTNNNGTSVSYTPNGNFFGTDSFTYTISDGNGGTDTATVNVTVTNVNDAPVATNDNYVTNSNVTLNVASPGVLSNDNDIDGPSLSAAYVAASGPSHGTLSLNGDGSFSYAPASNYTGPDSFTYRAFDGSLYSNIATVTITVNDTVAPTLNSTLAINLLTSTNSELINVGLNASATDNSGTPVQIQVAVFGDEDDETPTKQNVLHSPDAKDIGPNNTLRLRAERVEDNDGRVYLIIVTATDTSGNVSRSYHTVVVPKSNKQANVDSVNAQAAAAVTYAQTHNGAPPPGYFVIGDGPIIGPKQ